MSRAAVDKLTDFLEGRAVEAPAVEDANHVI
jgi:hypothetical protein